MQVSLTIFSGILKGTPAPWAIDLSSQDTALDKSVSHNNNIKRPPDFLNGGQVSGPHMEPEVIVPQATLPLPTKVKGTPGAFLLLLTLRLPGQPQKLSSLFSSGTGCKPPTAWCLGLVSSVYLPRLGVSSTQVGRFVRRMFSSMVIARGKTDKPKS